MGDPKQRFSDRAGNYAKHRPGYPGEVLDFLRERCGLARTSTVADVGSGTGLLSSLFLEHGSRVFAVEPNREMREAAEEAFGGLPRFESVAGAAEATTLPDASVDLVAAGNAFHWFDASAARAEFSRILKPGGCAAVLFNAPQKTGTPILEAHERLLSRYRKTDGGGVVGSYSSIEELLEGVEAFFGTGRYESADFTDVRSIDLESLKGLVLSYSNMPSEGEPGSREMLRELEEAFYANESGGRVAVDYAARVYCGSLP